MNELTFSWDDRKERENLRKHKVSFEEASQCSPMRMPDSNTILSIPGMKTVLFCWDSVRNFVCLLSCTSTDRTIKKLESFRHARPCQKNATNMDTTYEKRIRLF